LTTSSLHLTQRAGSFWSPRCSGILLIALLAAAFGQPMSGVYPVGSGGPGVDSFATVQAAANALNARGLAGNVEFPISQFVYSGPVTLRNVAGSRNYTIRFLPKTTGATIDAAGARYAFSVESTHNVTVRQLRFQGVRDTGSACIRFLDSDSGLVWSCRMVSDSAASGLRVERAVNFHLDTSRVEGTMRASGSRGLDFRECRFLAVRKCSILGTCNTGVAITGGSDNVTMMTGIKTATDTGLRVLNSPRISVTNCAALGSTANGLYVVDAPGAYFDSCLVNGTQQQGAYFESCDSLRSLATMLFGTGERGVRVVRSRDCNMMRLSVQTGPRRGLELDHSPSCRIDSLQVVNVHSDTAIGVLLDSSPACDFRWAMLYGDYGTAFRVNRSDGTRFAHTRVHGTAADAAMAFSQSSGVMVQPCSLYSSAPVGIVLADSCNDDTLARVVMLGATTDGIRARSGRGLVVANSLLRGWTAHGIALDSVQSPRLYYNTIVGPESAGVAGVSLSSVSGALAKDNIIWNRGLDTSACLRVAGLFPFGSEATDYNDLYASRGGGIARVNDTVFADLAEWREHPAAPDAHSLSRDPLFISGDNYHLDLSSPCLDSGMPIAGFLYDLELDQRDPLSPDIGADEYVPPAVSEARLLPRPFSFKLCGNPTVRGQLVIAGFTAASGRMDLSIIDAAGRAVLERWTEGTGAEHRIGLGSLHPGLYLVRVSDGNNAVTQKFVVAQ
jgi:hypothetical protein